MKKSFIISFLLSGMFLGTILVFQINTEKVTNSNFLLDEIEAREDVIKDFLDEQTYYQSRIVTLRNQIDEYQRNIETQSENYSLKLLSNLKKDIGLSELLGAGLDIYIGNNPTANDSENAAQMYVQASDLRDIVNALNSGYADAISINDKRVIASSAISSVGNNILVNNSHMPPPFKISAIGEKEMLLQTLSNKILLNDLYRRVELNGISFNIVVSDNVNINIFNGDLKTEHINLIN